MTYLLIDGENFKRKLGAVLRSSDNKRPAWHEYNFKGLFDKVLKDIKIDRAIFYFARVREHPDTKEKSKNLIEEQRLLKTHLEKQGFEVMLSGRIRDQMEDGFLKKKVLVFKEKGVDVKIAVDMVSWSCDEKVNSIILGSSDSDLQPAIQETRRRGVECVYLGFEKEPNKGLTFTTDRTILIRNSEILEFTQNQ
ncbi:MAG: NYN domain-containing protein [Candidatus Yanofskybacteria bacterium]|nr:NYN domain-containing protein [Candidatus Yanofskybacteria bacterium]